MFVVFEGIDGSGKTTVSNRVRLELEARGLQLKHLRESGRFASRVTESIRSLGRDSRNLELTPEAEFLLYVTRDVQLIEESLKPALAQVELILADRYLYTAENIGRYGRALPDAFMQPILAAAGRGVQPDLVVLVDVDPALGRARRQSDKVVNPVTKTPSRKGLSGTGLQRRLRAGYLELAARDPERWVVLDNSGRLDESVALIVRLIETALAGGVSRAVEQYQRDVREGAKQAPLEAPKTRGDDASPAARFFGWLDARSEFEPAVAAWMLAGLSGPSVDARRRRLAERAPLVILRGMEGASDRVSWELRESLLETHPEGVLASLKGLPDDVFEVPWFSALAQRFGAVGLKVLTGNDHPIAWNLRERLYAIRPAEVVSSLAGLDVAAAWAWRRDWLAREPAIDAGPHEAWAQVLARSLKGVAGERAHEMRQYVLDEAPVAVLDSLLGLDDAISWSLRRKYLTRAPKPVLGSIAGMDSAVAYDLRRESIQACREALEGLKHARSQAAFELREQAADRWPSTVLKSLGCAFDTERGRTLYNVVMSRPSSDLSLLKHATALSEGLVPCRCQLDPVAS